tara:strand:+ start:1607 stop:2119 length:513 start_codon:yes stop_codon:yes gene_type:complete
MAQPAFSGTGNTTAAVAPQFISRPQGLPQLGNQPIMSATEQNIFTQTNQDLRQRPQVAFSYRCAPTAPFTTDQGYGRNETKVLQFIPTMAPIINGTMHTTVETYNANNLNPRTLRNAAGSMPYGYGRGQVSMNTNLAEHAPQPLLPVNNADMFRQVAFDKMKAPVLPSKV